MEYSNVKNIIDTLRKDNTKEFRWINSEEEYLSENNEYTPGCYISKYGFYVIGTTSSGDAVTISSNDEKIRLCAHDDFYEDIISYGLKGTYEKKPYNNENVLNAQVILSENIEEFIELKKKTVKNNHGAYWFLGGLVLWVLTISIPDDFTDLQILLLLPIIPLMISPILYIFNYKKYLKEGSKIAPSKAYYALVYEHSITTFLAVYSGITSFILALYLLFYTPYTESLLAGSILAIPVKLIILFVAFIIGMILVFVLVNKFKEILWKAYAKNHMEEETMATILINNTIQKLEANPKYKTLLNSEDIKSYKLFMEFKDEIFSRLKQENYNDFILPKVRNLTGEFFIKKMGISN